MTWDTTGTMRSDWSFDTVRSMSAMGSLRNMARDIIMPPTIPDEDEQYQSTERSSHITDSVLATQGSQLSSSDGLVMNPAASHSTVIVKDISAEIAKGMDELVMTEEGDPSGISSFSRR
jgi:serine/threonine-protein kinase 24/25/MST4